MDDQKTKETISVKEIEEFAKKHRFEVFFSLLFLFACVFGIVGYFSASWNVFFTMGGSILGLIFPLKTEILMKKVFNFIFKQDKMVLLILGGVGLILSIFLPFLIFVLVGTFGGRSMHHMAVSSSLRQ